MATDNCRSCRQSRVVLALYAAALLLRQFGCSFQLDRVGCADEIEGAARRSDGLLKSPKLVTILHCRPAPQDGPMYRLLEPHPELTPWIQNYWMLTPAPGEQADVEVDVYVDARADLIFNFGAPYFRRVLGREEEEYRSSNLDAQRRRPIRIRQTGQAATVGVRFLAGGLAPFLRADANRITDRTPPPEEVFAPSVRDAEEALKRTIGNPDAAMDILDGFFLETRRLTTGVEDFRRLLAELESSTDGASIEILCGSQGFTPRNADRLFARYLGLSPKLYARIVRFQGALKFLMKDPGIGLAEVGHRFGYFDQSHFVKDFKAFAGGVPRGYRGYYPTDQPADFAPNIVRFLQDD